MGAPSPPYDEEEHHMENKRLAQFYKCVEWREKEEKTKGIQEQTCVAMRARVHFSQVCLLKKLSSIFIAKTVETKS